jgi:hypothetical protein
MNEELKIELKLGAIRQNIMSGSNQRNQQAVEGDALRLMCPPVPSATTPLIGEVNKDLRP